LILNIDLDCESTVNPLRSVIRLMAWPQVIAQTSCLGGHQ
jgi:hypothetical protein